MNFGRHLLKRWIDAFNARDVEQLIELAAPEIELAPLTLGGSEGVVFRGHKGFRTFLGMLFDKYTLIDVAYSHVSESGNRMVVPLTYTLAKNGEPRTTRHPVGVYEVVGGRMRRVEIYPDRASAEVAARSDAADLSAREAEILMLLGQGRRAEEIAEELVLSVHTVRTHVRNAKAKLGARTATEAVVIAVRRQAGRG